jgi:hypothetical protein
VFLIEKCSQLKSVSKTSLITILGANVDCVYSIKTEEKENTTGVMEGAETVPQRTKRTKVLWVYVLEPLDKATYWDHAPLPTEERRTLSRRSLMIAERKKEPSAKEEKLGDVLINKSNMKTKVSREPQSGKNSFRGVRCAERGVSSILLWQHEFYYVLEQEELSRRQLAPPKPYLYQALEFRLGCDLPDEEKQGMSRKQLREMWVLGVAYAPALNVRMYSTRVKEYLFHSEFNDSDARTGLFWRCPEVVRVDNSKAWRAMSKVLTTIPRVVHLDDVYSGAVHVAGRDLHYVCGMCAHENVPKKMHAKRKQEPWGFVLKKIIREEGGVQLENGFCMYPEERLGMTINSASIMWETLEHVFEGMRGVMRANGRARSGSFSMMWSASLQQLWEVSLRALINFYYKSVMHGSNPLCNVCYYIKGITQPDAVKVTARSNVATRCDALFKKESTNVDVHRTVTTYTSR